MYWLGRKNLEYPILTNFNVCEIGLHCPWRLPRGLPRGRFSLFPCPAKPHKFL